MAQRSANHGYLGGALRIRRAELGRTQAQVSDQAGMHRSYYGGMERGQRNATLEQLFKLEAALDTSASDLFRRAESLRRASD
jgi:transcriptional regulator with XRE-family HTH domain